MVFHSPLSFKAEPTVGFHPKGSGEDTSIVRTTTNIQKSRGPVGIASGHRSYKCFIFTSSKNGTGARHRGQIAPNRVTHRKLTEANGAGAVASNDGEWTNDGVFC